MPVFVPSFDCEPSPDRTAWGASRVCVEELDSENCAPSAAWSTPATNVGLVLTFITAAVSFDALLTFPLKFPASVVDIRPRIRGVLPTVAVWGMRTAG